MIFVLQRGVFFPRERKRHVHDYTVRFWKAELTQIQIRDPQSAFLEQVPMMSLPSPSRSSQSSSSQNPSIKYSKPEQDVKREKYGGRESEPEEERLNEWWCGVLGLRGQLRLTSGEIHLASVPGTLFLLLYPPEQGRNYLVSYRIGLLSPATSLGFS